MFGLLCDLFRNKLHHATELAGDQADAHLPATLDALAAAQHDDPLPEELSSRQETNQCERQLTQYRAALDAGSDPAGVGQWITETQARKLAAEARLRAQPGTPPRLTWADEQRGDHRHRERHHKLDHGPARRRPA